MTSFFEHFVRGRLSHAWPAYASGFAMLALAAQFHAPLWVWALLVPCLAICLIQMAIRPMFGMRLTKSKLLIYNGFRETALPLCMISYVRVTKSAYVVVMQSGQEIPLPGNALPNPLHLIREITDRGIPVRSV